LRGIPDAINAAIFCNSHCLRLFMARFLSDFPRIGCEDSSGRSCSSVMPGKEHRVLVEMFTHCPEMAVWLLERSGLWFPEYEHIEAADGRFTLVTAVGEKEMAADLVLICRDSRRDAVQTIIVEIQRGQDPGKVRSCHVYQAVYWAVLDCPVALVMVCSRREVARRFTKRFSAGVQDQVTPSVVLDLDFVPVLSPAEAQYAPPEWVLLELLSHGRRRGGPPVSLVACIAALAAVHANDPNRAARYTEVILGEWLGAQYRGAQYREEFMALLEDEEFTFEAEIFTRRIKAAEERAAQAAEERTAQAVEAKSLLSVLGARGFAVTAALREEILACGDAARLEGALVRAATGDAGQLFTF
jgi:hypothetical protein